jgi:hypothetical protein
MPGIAIGFVGLVVGVIVVWGFVRLIRSRPAPPEAGETTKSVSGEVSGIVNPTDFLP